MHDEFSVLLAARMHESAWRFVESAVSYAGKEWSSVLTFAAAHLAAGLELLLKARLVWEGYVFLARNPSITHKQFEKGDFQSNRAGGVDGARNGHRRQGLHDRAITWKRIGTMSASKDKDRAKKSFMNGLVLSTAAVLVVALIDAKAIMAINASRALVDPTHGTPFWVAFLIGSCPRKQGCEFRPSTDCQGWAKSPLQPHAPSQSTPRPCQDAISRAVGQQRR